MGICTSKNMLKSIDNIENNIIKGVAICQPQNIYDPSDDPDGNYMWISLHSTKIKELVEFQENGYIISMKQSKNIGQLWLRKKKI